MEEKSKQCILCKTVKIQAEFSTTQWGKNLSKCKMCANPQISIATTDLSTQSTVSSSTVPSATSINKSVRSSPARETTSQFLTRLDIKNTDAEKQLFDGGYELLTSLQSNPPSDSELKELGFKLFDRKKILKELSSQPQIQGDIPYNYLLSFIQEKGLEEEFKEHTKVWQLAQSIEKLSFIDYDRNSHWKTQAKPSQTKKKKKKKQLALHSLQMSQTIHQ